MADQNEKKGCKKAGRSTDKCKSYRLRQTRERNKLKRILQSNGPVAAEAYADLYGLYGYLRKLQK
jgi:hypothetical protein